MIIAKKTTYKAAVYCRVASASQADGGEIQKQRDALRIFANQQGLKVSAEYLDNGYIGNTLDRPAFAQMEADIHAGKIDTVIFRCIDRIARDFSLREKWISKMNKKGIRLIALDGSHEANNFMSDVLRDFFSKQAIKRNHGKKSGFTVP